jgi:hypoxanthine phosphoribosyltransferase
MSAQTRQEYLEILDHAECLFPAEVVAQAVARCARDVADAYAELDPLVLCVMVGGFRFTSDLLGHLEFPLEVDYLQLSRYRDRTRGGDLEWRRQPGASLRGRNVLVVDDILDEGVTLDAILRFCEAEGAASVAAAVLVDKRVEGRRLEADFAALVAPDRYLFGEGMDFKGYGRNLRGLWALAEDR